MRRLLCILLLLLSFSSSFGQTSIHDAVRTDNYNAITGFLDKGFDIDSLNTEGFAPIHYAAAATNLKMLQFLFEHRANPDRRDSRGMTALHWAAKMGNLESFKALIAIGADWDLAYQQPFLDDKTIPKYPINLAGEAGYGAIVDYIKSDEYPKTGQVLITLVKHADWDRFYKAAGDFPIDERDYLGATPLMYAAKTQYYKRWMSYLIDKGADPLKKDYFNRNLLHYAALYGSYDVVSMLKELKVDVEGKDSWGNTPIITAAWNSGASTFEELIAAGANVNIRDADGDTPLIIVLMKKKDDERALDIVKLLLKNHADPNVKGKDQLTALCRAIAGNKPQCVEFLLDNGADVNSTDSDGWTPVLQAAFMNSEESAVKMLELLLDKKPTNLSSKYQGKTALEIAQSKGFSEFAKMLE